MLTLRYWLTLGLVLTSTACQTTATGLPGAASMVPPASPGATEVLNLWWLLFAVMLAILVGVTAVLILAYVRFRVRPGYEQGRIFFGNTRLEIAWTIAPVTILVVVFLLSLQVIEAVEHPAGGTVRVTAVGHQFWWEYRLPDLGVVTANELHLPVGEQVVLELTSNDVIHSWWVPQLAVKRDMVPGQVNPLAFLPEREGVFLGPCAEFCGAQHAWMRLRVVVEDEAVFQDWVRLQNQEAAEPQTELAERGREIFLRSTCASCHAIRGTDATSDVGPDLTHVASRETLAAGALPMSPENMELWLRAPQEVKPGNLMPNAQMTEDEIEALTAYMMELR